MAGDLENSKPPEASEMELAPPPSVHGPNFVLLDGKLAIAPPDDQGLDLARLGKVIPLLREQTKATQNHLRGKNSHPELERNVEKYAELLKPEVAEIDYESLTLRGIMLNNADQAASRQVDRLIPALEDEARAALSSLLELHGMAVMATETGRSLLAEERNYARNPTDASAFKEAGEKFAAAIQHFDLATPDAQDMLDQSTSNIGGGSNQQRSSVAADRVLIKVGVALLAGGVAVSALPVFLGSLGWAAALIVGEGIKRSKVGQSAAEIVKEAINDPKQYSNLVKVRTFIDQKEDLFRTLAGDRREFEWFHKALDFIKGKGSGSSGSTAFELMKFPSAIGDSLVGQMLASSDAGRAHVGAEASPIVFRIEMDRRGIPTSSAVISGILLDKWPTQVEMAELAKLAFANSAPDETRIIALIFRVFVQHSTPRKFLEAQRLFGKSFSVLVGTTGMGADSNTVYLDRTLFPYGVGR